MVREDWGTTPAKAPPQQTIPNCSREQMERNMTIPSSTTHPNAEQRYEDTVEDLTPGQFTKQFPLPQRIEWEIKTDVCVVKCWRELELLFQQMMKPLGGYKH